MLTACMMNDDKFRKHNANSAKLKDVGKINKKKQKLQDILSSHNVEFPQKSVAKATKFISRLVSLTFESRANGDGPVTLDRKLKLVEWACKTTMESIHDIYFPLIDGQVKTKEEKQRTILEINRACGDICRYMFLSKSITRTQRELTAEELYTRDFWATKAIETYDHSNVSLASYDVRIKHMFNETSPYSILLSVLFNLRKLSQTSALERKMNLKPVENRYVFVEQRALVLKDYRNNDILFHGAALCVCEIINHVKHMDTGFSMPSGHLERKLDPVRREWNKLQASQTPDINSVDAIIFTLVMLADTYKNSVMQPPLILFSTLLKITPLRNRVQSLINPEDTLKWGSPYLQYFYENTNLDGDPFMIKLQKLNSRPAFF